MRALLLALTLTSCTAQTPAPCVQPDERIELHDAESVTTAGLEEMYGAQLLGGPHD